jgi:hypothetical protein
MEELSASSSMQAPLVCLFHSPGGGSASLTTLDWRAKFILFSLLFYMSVNIITAIATSTSLVINAAVQTALFTGIFYLLFRLFLQHNRDWFAFTSYLMILWGIGSITNIVMASLASHLNFAVEATSMVFIVLASVCCLISLGFYAWIQGNYGQTLGGYYYPQQAVGYPQGGGYTQGGQILVPPADYQVPAQGYAPPQEYAGDQTRPPI